MMTPRIHAIGYFSNTTQLGFHKDWTVHKFNSVRHANELMCLCNESVLMVPHFDYGKDVR